MTYDEAVMSTLRVIASRYACQRWTCYRSQEEVAKELGVTHVAA
jgi:hypothetical protein